MNLYLGKLVEYGGNDFTKIRVMGSFIQEKDEALLIIDDAHLINLLMDYEPNSYFIFKYMGMSRCEVDVHLSDIASDNHAYFVFSEYLRTKVSFMSQEEWDKKPDIFTAYIFKTVISNVQPLVTDGLRKAVECKYQFTDFVCTNSHLEEYLEKRIVQEEVENQINDDLEKQGWKKDSYGYWHDGIFVSEEQKRFFDSALELAKIEPTVIMMKGESGYGKTTLPKLFAEVNNMNHIRFNCAGVRDPEEWFFFREARDGSTVLDKTPLTRMIEQGNAVIVFDDFNRVEPWIHNTLFPLWDDDHATTIHNMDITCGENILFVATINEGMRYAGTFFIDIALTNRVTMTTRVKPLPTPVYEKIGKETYGITNSKKHADVFNKLRLLAEEKQWDVDVSTRSFHKVCKLLSRTKLSVIDVYMAVIGESLSETDKKSLIDAVGVM